MENLEDDLLYALKETLIKQQIELTKDNYVSLLRCVILNILQNNDYTNITRNNGARNTIEQYDRSEILTYICLKISEKKGISSTILYKDTSKKKNYLDLVYTYANDIFPNYILNEKSTSELIFYDDSIGEAIESVKFFKSSATLKEAINNQEQIKVSCSRALINQMNAYSDIGKRKPRQEDSYYIGSHPDNHDFQMMIVCDGMGGHPNGELASNLITNELIKWFDSLDSNEYYNSEDKKIIPELHNKLIQANKYLMQKYPYAGTTLCISIVTKNNIIMCNIGDSQGLVLKNNNIIFATEPDKDIKDSVPFQEPFIRFLPSSSRINNDLGKEEFKFNYRSINIQPDNEYKIIICSDGVSDILTNPEIGEIVRNCKTIDEASSSLVRKALDTSVKFGDFYKSFFSTPISKITYYNLKQLLNNYYMNENYEYTVEGGRDNTTAVVGQIRR